LFAGIREHKYGIEALTPNLEEARKKFKTGAVIEKATLEDIMYYTGKR